MVQVKHKYQCNWGSMSKLRENTSMINVGFSNVVFTDKVLAMVSPDSAPIKRLINEAKENLRLIDATYGRKTKTVIILTSGHVMLSALAVETLSSRVS